MKKLMMLVAVVAAFLRIELHCQCSCVFHRGHSFLVFIVICENLRDVLAQGLAGFLLLGANRIVQGFRDLRA